MVSTSTGALSAFPRQPSRSDDSSLGGLEPAVAESVPMGTVHLPSPREVGMTVYMRAYREARRMGLIGVDQRFAPEPDPKPDWTDDDFRDERPGHCWRCSEPTKGDLCGFCLRELAS